LYDQRKLKVKLPVFIFIHGGGWVLGDYQTHKRLVRDLVIESGYACVFIEYSRSPEAKYPIALNECYAATKWVSEHGDEINVDGKRLAIVGNSAGGNMTIGTCLKAKNNKGPNIKCQILLWPYSDAGINTESFKNMEKKDS
jgi:Esterase/lipase